tara:strand:- start:420 stop:536 length:117 start_codon:yes stop_codon:yes gene_type:complete
MSQIAVIVALIALILALGMAWQAQATDPTAPMGIVQRI